MANRRVLLAAALLAGCATPAFAQTQSAAPDRPPGRQDTSPPVVTGCAEGATLELRAGRDPCPPDRLPDGRVVVVFPDLLADLFEGLGFPDGPPPPGGRVPPTPAGPDGNPPAPPATGSGNAGGSAPGVFDQGIVTLPGTPLPSARPIQGVATSTIPPAAPVRAISGAHVPDEVLVTIDGDQQAAAAIAAAFGLEVRSVRVSGLLGSTLVRFGIPDGRPVGLVLAQLADDGRLRTRAPNHIYALQQAAPLANYAFERIVLDAASASGESIAVAVIDGAVDDRHPSLDGVIVALYDALPGEAVADRSHGTSISGLIAGIGDFRGTAPGARIHHARAFENGTSTMAALIDALDWAAGERVRIINMSFTGPRNDFFAEAVAAADALGIVMVAAAGNNGPGAPFAFPAAYDEVIAVTATDSADALMQMANRGPYVLVAAPGVDMLAPIPGGGADVVTGTSFAAAVASGAIANLVRQHPVANPAMIRQALSATALDLGPAGKDNDFGHGLINASRALAAIE